LQEIAMKFRFVLAILALAVGLGMAQPITIELILDVSESMAQEVDGVVKIDAAKQAILEILKELDTSFQIGFRVYGHRYPTDDPNTCQDTELLQPIAPFTPEVHTAIAQALETLTPKGKTPIAYALEQAINDLAALPGESAIILVSDGEETCGGSWETAIQKIEELNRELRIYVIGFDVASKESLEPIATATGGTYYAAANAAELVAALETAFQEAAAQTSEPGLEIVIEEADAVWESTSLTFPEALATDIANMDSYIFLDHWQTSLEIFLGLDEGLAAYLSGIDPRIVTEYAQTVHLLPLKWDAELNALVAGVLPTICINYAAASLWLPLSPPW